MSIYAIGDIQGCFSDLERLLEKICFDPCKDHLWFSGDLVNRGPESLKTLRFVKRLGNCAIAILGNHDLHLLACHYGRRQPHKNDTFDDILTANDRDELLDWLRHRPFLHTESDICLVHAGIPPEWDIQTAQRCAAKVEKILRDTNKVCDFFTHMYGDTPQSWSETADEWSEIRFIVNAFTRMRYCRKDGSIDTKYKGVPGMQPGDLIPWFEHPNCVNRGFDIIFGHWSTLGLFSGEGIYNIDTGCVWGGKLTALKIERKEYSYFQVDCECKQSPDIHL